MRGATRWTDLARAGLVAVCAVVTVGCRDTVSRGAPTPTTEAPAPAGPAAPSAATSAAAFTELAVSLDGCWGAARGAPDALLRRAEERCAGGMARATGPADLAAPVKLGGAGHACHRVALVGAGALAATLTDSTGFAVAASGDGALLLPPDGPLCVSGELTLTSSRPGAVRFIAWRAGP